MWHQDASSLAGSASSFAFGGGLFETALPATFRAPQPAVFICRRQLVYACGTAQSMPALQDRTIVIQALLRLVSDMIDAGTCPELAAEDVAAWKPSIDR